MSRAKTELLKIARVLKSNGTEGGILVSFREIDPEDLKITEPVFIDFDGLPVPFFFDSFAKKGTNRAIATLTGIKSLADAEEIVGKDIFASPDAIEEYEDEEEGLTLDDLIGWDLLDENGEKVGEITDYEDIPGNPCLDVTTKDGQAMLPFHENLIISIDEENGAVTMTIPEGLL